MNVFDATIFGLTAWRVIAVVALLLLYVLLVAYWRRQEATQAREATLHEQTTNAHRDNPNIPSARPWKRKPPVDLTDTQRIDHLHRLVSLKAGEQADLKGLSFGRLKEFRVAFAGVEHSSGKDFAHINIDLGGAKADCGKSIEELDDNDFLVPHAAPGDQSCTIHYTCGKTDAVSHVQVKVLQFDAVGQSASIDVLHVRGRRAA